MADTMGTAKVPEAELVRAVREIFPLTPKGIIEYLDLRRPIYKKTAAYGHFGRSEPEFTWEKTGKAAELKAFLKH
jgi:S-adenosylmethionine synthetase